MINTIPCIFVYCYHHHMASPASNSIYYSGFWCFFFYYRFWVSLLKSSLSLGHFGTKVSRTYSFQSQLGACLLQQEGDRRKYLYSFLQLRSLELLLPLFLSFLPLTFSLNLPEFLDHSMFNLNPLKLRFCKEFLASSAHLSL